MTVAVLVPHRIKPEAGQLGVQATQWLRSRGHIVRIAKSDNTHSELSDVDVVDDDEVGVGADIAISIGGDGTMLHAVDLVAEHNVPVLGINAGHLGYLTAVPSSELTAALEHFTADEFHIEERMMLSVTVEMKSGEIDSRTAFNEIVVEKTVSGHTVHLAIEIGGRPFLTYAADGMIVATPSGSTAYNLSARGPIVSPHLRAIIVTPVSPHMLFDRTLVLRPEEFVKILVIEGRPANLVVDGMLLGQLRPGDSIRCEEAPHPARLITFDTRDVHTILRTKFGLSDR